MKRRLLFFAWRFFAETGHFFDRISLLITKKLAVELKKG